MIKLPVLGSLSSAQNSSTMLPHLCSTRKSSFCLQIFWILSASSSTNVWSNWLRNFPRVGWLSQLKMKHKLTSHNCQKKWLKPVEIGSWSLPASERSFQEFTLSLPWLALTSTCRCAYSSLTYLDCLKWFVESQSHFVLVTLVPTWLVLDIPCHQMRKITWIYL